MADELRPDIEAAKQKMRVKFGGGRELKKLVEHLWEGETVERMTTGQYGKGAGLVVLTDRRLLFVLEGLVSKSSEDFPLDRISSVAFNSGMVMGTINVFASGAKAEIKNVVKADGKEIVDLLRARLAQPSTAAAPAAAPAAPDVMAQLKQLGELRESGVLSDAEFDAKKAELLARL